MIIASARLAGALGLAAIAAMCAPVSYKDRCLDDLTAQIPAILKSQDRATGRFGTGIWIVTDQDVMLPLAAAWSIRSPQNPYYHSSEVLDAIMSGGDALIADQGKDGRWEFRKKDGSTWGPIYMPWTYSRWIRAYSLVREVMPAERRTRWDKGLLLGFNGIAAEVAKAKPQNIPAHHAMALYFAGTVFEKPEWRQLSHDFIAKVAADQHPDGYWSEHVGPVVNYGFVYVDAVGTYLAASHDESVRPVVRRAALFHSRFTYPDGTDVETVDERNPYHGGVRLPNVGFTFSPEGRSYLAHQIALTRGRLAADIAASLLLWGEDGEGVEATASGDFDYVLPSGDAAVRRRGPWFLVVSALTAEPSGSRWIQDRQNFISIFHDQTGLILGGGNTKLQPRWSNFTSGDVSLLRLKPGDENPKFFAPAGLVHVPNSAKLLRGEEFGLELDYGGRRARITLKVAGPDRLEYSWSGDEALTAHVTLLPQLKKSVKTATGESLELGERAVELNPGASIDYLGIRIGLPEGTSLRWPVLPHNPYRKDGRAAADEGRIVLDSAVKGVRTIVLQMQK